METNNIKKSITQILKGKYEDEKNDTYFMHRFDGPYIVYERCLNRNNIYISLHTMQVIQYNPDTEEDEKVLYKIKRKYSSTGKWSGYKLEKAEA